MHCAVAGMNYLHAPKHSGALRWVCIVSTLCAACSVYDSSLLGAAAPIENGAGTDNKDHVSGGDGSAGLAQGAAPGGNAGSAGAPSQGGSAGSATSTAGESGSAVVSSAGSGGDAGSGGVDPELRFEPLDDMEDGNAFVLSAGERDGHWDVSNDATIGGTQTPPAASFSMIELVDAARPDSHFAAYTQGKGFKGWGAVMTVSMITWPDYEATPTYDASAYAGVSFYAKAGVGSDLTLRIRFVGAQTDARGDQCTPGGTLATACYDHFYEDVKLSHDWQRFDLKFADFKQAGVGKKFPSIDLATMYALEFFFPGRSTASGNAFELWVDDLAFVLK
jgi:hypothetical protein